MVPKPDRIFDRDTEWRRLSTFATREGNAPRLGVVSGRRRQGKTFLLDALTRATGGLYFGATQATETESLHLFGDALGGHLGAPVPYRFAGWDEAVRQLVTSAVGGPVVLDEFPYLSGPAPALPSILQREIDRAASDGRPIPPIVLCGSAMSVMGGLLGGTAPLRGRATLEMIIQPFPYPLAARYWEIDDPHLALRVHAVVGGTPAYRRFVGDDRPDGDDDFDAWVLRTVLDPTTPLFREARYLLEEEVDVRETGLYHSVLAAVAGGNGTRGGIASYVGRRAADIGHHLNVLEDARLVRREPDLFRANRSRYRLAEPLLTFYQVVMRPQWGLLESGRGKAVWADARARFAAQVMGPHFEELCREHALMAPPELFGGLPGVVGSGVVSDPTRRTQIEIDVVALAPAVPGEQRRVLALGEAKWGEVIGPRHVQRLARARDLLAERGWDTRATRLVGYSGAGFAAELTAEAGVRTVGPEQLYASAAS